jgi:hypothetical protein
MLSCKLVLAWEWHVPSISQGVHLNFGVCILSMTNISYYACMLQNVRIQLDWSALTFGSPWYKLLYAVMPWLAGAKRVRNGMQGVRQVSFLQAHAARICTVALTITKCLCLRCTKLSWHDGNCCHPCDRQAMAHVMHVNHTSASAREQLHFAITFDWPVAALPNNDFWIQLQEFGATSCHGSLRY